MNCAWAECKFEPIQNNEYVGSKWIFCSACYGSLYCCRDHQVSDWALHKSTCRKLPKEIQSQFSQQRRVAFSSTSKLLNNLIARQKMKAGTVLLTEVLPNFNIQGLLSDEALDGTEESSICGITDIALKMINPDNKIMSWWDFMWKSFDTKNPITMQIMMRHKKLIQTKFEQIQELMNKTTLDQDKKWLSSINRMKWIAGCSALLQNIFHIETEQGKSKMLFRMGVNFCNHSCRPNAMITRSNSDENPYAMCIVLQDDVIPGEPITVSYQTKEIDFHPTLARLQTILSQNHFQCVCEWCCLESESSKEYEQLLNDKDSDSLIDAYSHWCHISGLFVQDRSRMPRNVNQLMQVITKVDEYHTKQSLSITHWCGITLRIWLLELLCEMMVSLPIDHAQFSKDNKVIINRWRSWNVEAAGQLFSRCSTAKTNIFAVFQNLSHVVEDNVRSDSSKDDELLDKLDPAFYVWKLTWLHAESNE